MDDPLLAVEATLTDEARESWLRKAFEMYPQLRGAKVADVLENLDSTDAFLSLIEPWWESHGQKFAAELLPDPGLLKASAYLAIVATGASNSVPFDALAEAVARAAVAGEAGVIGLEHVRDVPDDGLYHGPDLDAAMAVPGGPAGMGVCLTALESRREMMTDLQMNEAAFATAVLSGEEPDPPQGLDAVDAAALAGGLRELKGVIEAGKGKPMTREEASMVALRTIIGGTFSRGIEVGLNLARNRLAKAREATIRFDNAGCVEVEAAWGTISTDVPMIEKVKV